MKKEPKARPNRGYIALAPKGTALVLVEHLRKYAPEDVSFRLRGRGGDKANGVDVRVADASHIAIYVYRNKKDVLSPAQIQRIERRVWNDAKAYENYLREEVIDLRAKLSDKETILTAYREKLDAVNAHLISINNNLFNASFWTRLKFAFTNNI